MMKRRAIMLPVLLVLAIPTVGFSQRTESGAAIGGIGGALAGAAIGKHNGETAAGALIGGAVGLVTGAAIGNAADARDRRQAYAHQQWQYQAQQAQQAQLASAVSSTDVISMSRNGLGEDVIINHIRQNGVQRRPDVHEVISLHKQGVGERVIAAMQTASVGSPAYAAPAAATPYVARPVIVEQHHYVRPSYWDCPPYYHHHYYHPRPRSHVHWGVTYGF